MIRVAAVGDVHYDQISQNRLRNRFEGLNDRADLLLVAGDLTQSGSIEEVKSFVSDLKSVSIPVVVVLGNHDFHRNQEKEIQNILKDAGVIPLEGATAHFRMNGDRVAVFGLKGFGGGFGNACCSDFGEPETKAFAKHAQAQSEILLDGLKKMEADYRFVLLHYSPIEGTLFGERREIYPFLGSYLLAEAIDEDGGADGVFHGHAHFGIERGSTPGGVPVRNVAQMVIRHAYKIYTFKKQTVRSGVKAGG